jgi:hypothetical protein
MAQYWYHIAALGWLSSMRHISQARFRFIVRRKSHGVGFGKPDIRRVWDEFLSWSSVTQASPIPSFIAFPPAATASTFMGAHLDHQDVDGSRA